MFSTPPRVELEREAPWAPKRERVPMANMTCASCGTLQLIHDNFQAPLDVVLDRETFSRDAETKQEQLDKASELVNFVGSTIYLPVKVMVLYTCPMCHHEEKVNLQQLKSMFARWVDLKEPVTSAVHTVLMSDDPNPMLVVQPELKRRRLKFVEEEDGEIPA